MGEQIFQYITGLDQLALWAVFAVLILCGLGLPLPEDIPLIAAGYIVYLGDASFAMAYFLGMAGVLIGDSVIFFIGRHFGSKLLRSRLVLTLTTPEKIAKVENYYEKYGNKIIFFGRFMAGARAPIFFVAGASKVKYYRFIFLDGFAALISVPVWIWVGLHFGGEIDHVFQIVRKGKEVALGIGAVLIVALAFYFFKRSRNAARAAQKRNASKTLETSEHKAEIHTFPSTGNKKEVAGHASELQKDTV